MVVIYRIRLGTRQMTSTDEKSRVQIQYLPKERRKVSMCYCQDFRTFRIINVLHYNTALKILLRLLSVPGIVTKQYCVTDYVCFFQECWTKVLSSFWWGGRNCQFEVLILQNFIEQVIVLISNNQLDLPAVLLRRTKWAFYWKNTIFHSKNTRIFLEFHWDGSITATLGQNLSNWPAWYSD